MDEKVWMALLLDFYGSLLTDRQRRAMDLYYSEDYSLGEIAELENISRQGVRDAVKRSEQILKDTEQKLRLARRYMESSERINELIQRFEAAGDMEAAARLRDINSIWERE